MPGFPRRLIRLNFFTSACSKYSVTRSGIPLLCKVPADRYIALNTAFRTPREMGNPRASLGPESTIVICPKGNMSADVKISSLLSNPLVAVSAGEGIL